MTDIDPDSELLAGGADASPGPAAPARRAAAKSSASYMNDRRALMKDLGFVRHEIWVKPEMKPVFNDAAKLAEDGVPAERIFLAAARGASLDMIIPAQRPDPDPPASLEAGPLLVEISELKTALSSKDAELRSATSRCGVLEAELKVRAERPEAPSHRPSAARGSFGRRVLLLVALVGFSAAGYLGWRAYVENAEIAASKARTASAEARAAKAEDDLKKLTQQLEQIGRPLN